MAFGVISIPGASGPEAPQRRVNGYAVSLGGPTVSANLTPGPGVLWDAFTATNYSSDWVRFELQGTITGDRSGLIAPGGGTVALSFGDGGNNPITDIEFTAVDLTGLVLGTVAVGTIPAVGSAAGDGIISVIMQEK